jgi:putative FmdB family regulatory protein
MPTYVYHCNICGKSWEAFHTIAERKTEKCCGKEATIVPSCNVHVFKPFWNEHLEPDRSIYIRSKGHYKEELKQRGMTCPNL